MEARSVEAVPLADDATPAQGQESVGLKLCSKCCYFYPADHFPQAHTPNGARRQYTVCKGCRRGKRPKMPHTDSREVVTAAMRERGIIPPGKRPHLTLGRRMLLYNYDNRLDANLESE